MKHFCRDIIDRENWVGIGILRKEFGISDAIISRWAEKGYIKRQAVDWGQTRWAYDKKNFAENFGKIRIMEEKIKHLVFKKWCRKRDIEAKRIETGIE